MKRIIFICLFSLFWSSVAISEPKTIDCPTMIRIHLAGVYKRSIHRLMDAQIYVESRGNPFAISPFGDYGILQIRQIKLDDYYQKTGIRYTLQDCFNPEVSKEVYLYYANRIGTTPDKWETIARAWAGGLSRAKHECTLDYWQKVNKQLNKVNV